jgi:predicted methyltransferase
MIDFIKMMKNNSFYKSEQFYTDVYKVENLGDIKHVQGSTIEIANKYGWFRAIYHEIFSLLDYYKDKQKTINEGDVVVDLGGNVGIFNRWAYSQGASKVISFEPDKRYFKLLL